MNKWFFTVSIFLSCGLFAMSEPAPKLVVALSRTALIDLVPGSEHGECEEHSETSHQNSLNPLSEFEYKAACSKQTFVHLLAKAKDRILGDPSMSDALEFSFQGIKDKLFQDECRLLDECAEAYYREKPKNSIDFGYRSSEEFAKHYKSACIKMGVQPEPFFSQQLFFEVLVEKENSLITYANFARGKGYGFFMGDEVSVFNSLDKDRKERAEADRAEADARKAEADARKANAEANRAEADAAKAWAEAGRAKADAKRA